LTEPRAFRSLNGWPRGSRGGLAGIRTRDLQIKSPLLYRLSYEPTHADAR
jgi:hypothetical protein